MKNVIKVESRRGGRTSILLQLDQVNSFVPCRGLIYQAPTGRINATPTFLPGSPGSGRVAGVEKALVRSLDSTSKGQKALNSY